MNYDEIFTQIAGRTGSLDKTLDAFFGFLSRRTDLYVTFDEEQKNAPMGFPKGVAEQMVLKSMRKFPYRPLNKNSNSNSSGKSEDLKVGKEKVKDVKCDQSPASSSLDQAKTNDQNNTVFNNDNNNNNNNNNDNNHNHNNYNNSNSIIKYTDDGKQIPIGNGGVADGYHWTQTLNEVTIHVLVPFGSRSKDVTCTIKTNTLLLVVNGLEILSGSFLGEIHADESIWTLDTTTLPTTTSSSDSGGSSGSSGETYLVLTMEKRTETWWSSVLVGGPEIDTTKVDSTRNISEYDDATQASIRKLMFEQHQRRKGLATRTTEEEQVTEMLEKAKLAQGSPFL